MGEVIRRSGTTALLSYLGFFIGYVNMLLLLPYAFRPEEVGLIRLLLSVAALASTLASFGGTQVVIRFFPFFADSDIRRAAFTRLLLLLGVAGSIVFTVCLFLFRDEIVSIYAGKSPLFVSYLWFTIPLTISLILYGVVEAFVLVQGRPIIPTLFREVYTRGILTVGALTFLALSLSLRGFFQLIGLLYCLAPMLIFLYGYRLGLLPLTGTARTIRGKELKELTSFGWFMFLGNASAVVLANIDSLVLGASAGLVSTGIYSVAMFIAVIIQIPKQSLSRVLIPLVVTANKERDVRTLDLLYKKTSLNQFVIGAGIFLIIWLNIDALFTLIPNGQLYSEGKWVVLFVSIARLFDMLTGCNAEIIGTSEYYKLDLVIYFILSIVGIGLNVILIPSYGVNGAAVALLASVVLYNTMRFILIAVVMKIQPFTRKTVITLVCVGLTYILISLIPHVDSVILDAALRSVMIAGVFGGTILGFQVSEDISGYAREILQYVRKR